MKKIIVTMADVDAIEVRENHRLAPRYGMNQLSFQELVKKEKAVTEKCEKIIKKGKFPSTIKGLIDYGILENNDELQDFFKVLEKVHNLLKERFHVLIVRGMLNCACGEESGLGYGCFDEKFSLAFTDVEVRKDFWGTESLFPIKMVSALLLDFMNGVDSNIKKSQLIRCCLTHYLESE